jgi:hypothetical protein
VSEPVVCTPATREEHHVYLAGHPLAHVGGHAVVVGALAVVRRWSEWSWTSARRPTRWGGRERGVCVAVPRLRSVSRFWMSLVQLVISSGWHVMVKLVLGPTSSHTTSPLFAVPVVLPNCERAHACKEEESISVRT